MAGKKSMGDKFSSGEAPEDSVFEPKGRSYLEQFSDWLKPDHVEYPDNSNAEVTTQPGQEPGTETVQSQVSRGLKAVEEKPRRPEGPDAKSEPLSNAEVKSFAEPAAPKGPATRPSDRQGIKKAVDATKKGAAAGDTKPALQFTSTVEAEANRTLPPDEAGEFRNEMKELKTWLANKNEDIDRKQLIETVGQALTQLAGGLYGLKHGQDMSGMKFDKTDWDKRRGLAMEEFRTNLQDIGEQRKESQVGKENEKNRAAEATNLGTKEAGENTRLGIREEGENTRSTAKLKMDKYIAELNAEVKRSSKTDTEAKEKANAFKAAQSKLGEASRADKKGDDDTRDTNIQAARGLMEDAGLSEESIKSVLSRPTTWYEFGSETETTPVEAATKLNDIKSGGAKAKPKTIIQNGHTYTLNEQTGKYE